MWLGWGEFVAERSYVTSSRQTGLWEWHFCFSDNSLLFLSYERNQERDEECRRGWMTAENLRGKKEGGGKWVTVTAEMILWGKEPGSSRGTAAPVVFQALKEMKWGCHLCWALGSTCHPWPQTSAPLLRSQNQRPGGKRRLPAAEKMHRNTSCQGQPLVPREQWTSAWCFAGLGAALSSLQHCFHLGQSSSFCPNSSGKHGKYLQRNTLPSGMKSEETCKSQLICVSFVYSVVPDSKLNNLCLPLTGFSSMEQHT